MVKFDTDELLRNAGPLILDALYSLSGYGTKEEILEEIKRQNDKYNNEVLIESIVEALHAGKDCGYLGMNSYNEYFLLGNHD